MQTLYYTYILNSTTNFFLLTFFFVKVLFIPFVCFNNSLDFGMPHTLANSEFPTN